MNKNYLIHDKQYMTARKNGWDGWGGNERIAKGNEFINRLLSYPSIPTSGKILELGCGEGHISRLLFEKNYQVTGIDISNTAIEWAKEKAFNLNYDICFLVKDLTTPETLPNLSFDIVVDGNCYHCIIDEDRNIFLKNIYNALKLNGMFFISSLCSKEDFDEKIYLDDKAYRHIPSIFNIISELENANFEILKKVVYQREKYNHINIHAKKLVIICK